MTTSKHTHHTAVGSTVLCAGVLALLTACGGGPASPSAGAYDNSSVGGNYIVQATVKHAQNNESYVNSTQGTALSAPVDAMTKVTSVSQYTLSNSVHSMDVDTFSASAAGFATITDNQKSVKVGGTTWLNSRFGLFQDKESNSDGQNTEYIVRTYPYGITQIYPNATPVSAAYNTSGKATGTYITGGVQWRNFGCDVNVVLSVTDTTREADVSLSNCVDAEEPSITYDMTGLLRLTKTLPIGNVNASASGFTATLGGATESPRHTLTPNYHNGKFELGGPNADEIVGTIYIAGPSYVTADISKQTMMTFSFGALKTNVN